MKYFYFDADSRSGIESAAAIEGHTDDIITTWESLSRQAGSFLGIHCCSGVVLQFMWDDSDFVTIDIPLPKRGGSMAKRASLAECNAAINHVCSGGNPENIQGLEFVKW
jgi:hypothetical protein